MLDVRPSAWIAIPILAAALIAGRAGYNLGLEDAPDLARKQAETSALVRSLMASSAHDADMARNGPDTRSDACGLFFDHAERIIDGERVSPDQ